MAESNALKGTCLEHLASIAGHLFARKNIVAQKYTLLPLSQLLVSSDTFSSGFEELCVAWHDLIGSLWLAHDEDDASEVRFVRPNVAPHRLNFFVCRTLLLSQRVLGHQSFSEP